MKLKLLKHACLQEIVVALERPLPLLLGCALPLEVFQKGRTTKPSHAGVPVGGEGEGKGETLKPAPFFGMPLLLQKRFPRKAIHRLEGSQLGKGCVGGTIVLSCHCQAPVCPPESARSHCKLNEGFAVWPNAFQMEVSNSYVTQTTKQERDGE